MMRKPDCAKCGKIKEQRLQAYCNFCKNEYQKKFYKTHPYSTDESLKRRRKALRDFIKEQKNRPCADCGKEYPWYVMDFDHIYGKKFLLSKSTSRMASLKSVALEISKCEVVCANCHRIRTYNRKQGNLQLTDGANGSIQESESCDVGSSPTRSSSLGVDNAPWI